MGRSEGRDRASLRTSVTRYLVDTNVFLYARGREHPLRDACRTILAAAARQEVLLEASVELVQEFAHVLLRRDVPRELVLVDAADVRAQCLIHDFDTGVLAESLRLLGAYPQLGARDAVHAATALRAGIDSILSADFAFDVITELERIDPARLAATFSG